METLRIFKIPESEMVFYFLVDSDIFDCKENENRNEEAECTSNSKTQLVVKVLGECENYKHSSQNSHSCHETDL